MTGAKYEILSSEIKSIYPIDGPMALLRRIRALQDIPRYDVKAGDLGGYVEGEQNLSQEGDCWIGGKAFVYREACVCDHAQVTGKAQVRERASVSGYAQVRGAADVSDDAKVQGLAVVGGSSCIRGSAEIRGGYVFGNSTIFGHAIVEDKAQVSNVYVFGQARIYGMAVLEGGNERISVYENAQVYGHAHLSGRSIVRGSSRVFGHAQLRESAQVCEQGVVCDRAIVMGTSFVAGRSVLYGEGLLYGDSALLGGVLCNRTLSNFTHDGHFVLDRVQDWVDKFSCTERNWMLSFLHNVPHQYVYSVTYTDDYVLYCIDPCYARHLQEKLRVPSSRLIAQADTRARCLYLAASLCDLEQSLSAVTSRS